MPCEPSMTPVTEYAFHGLRPADADWVEQHDEEQLADERSRVAPWVAKKLMQPTHGIRGMLREWEALIVAMEEGCQGSVLIDDYMYVLDLRVSLEEAVRAYDPSRESSVARGLDKLDQRFLRQSEQDGETGAGHLTMWLRPLNGRDPLWLFNRRPRKLLREEG